MTTDRYREPVEGTAFGRYQLIELLGRGGMGEVWKAHDTAIDRVVAVKLLLPQYAQDPEFTERFSREARAAARLDDPHVVPIYDVGELDGRLYLIMRLITGWDLQSVLRRGPLPPARAVSIIEQVASALQSAHQVGLVHRDVKPSNILLADRGPAPDFAYLIDFGLARAAGESALTSTSMTVGTWSYMAPERFTTRDIAPSSDIYALTCVLYECLTGQVPYPGDTLEVVASSHMTAPPPKPSLHHGVPQAMDEVIAIGLAKQPAHRYATAMDLAGAARRALGPSTLLPPPPPDSALTQPSRYVGDEAPTTPAYVGGLRPAAPSKRRPYLIAGALTATALLVAVGVFAAIRFARNDTSASPQPTPTGTASPTGPPANTGPFTGVYRADFGPATSLDGGPAPGAQPSSGTYGVRSVCEKARCTATAAKFEGAEAFAGAMVFDQVGDTWLSVAVDQGQCNGAPTETWQTFRLQPRPDGTLVGEHIRTTARQCAEKRTVTFTRTGDVDVNADFYTLPDPAALPPRTVSPGEGLRGRYHITRSFTPPGLPVFEADSSAVTSCLRDGIRCLTYFVAASGDLPLVFEAGQWTTTDRTEGPCPSGDLAQLTADATFPMPQPPQDPVQRLEGRGTWVQTGSCAINLDYTETLTRMGD